MNKESIGFLVSATALVFAWFMFNNYYVSRYKTEIESTNIVSITAAPNLTTPSAANITTPSVPAITQATAFVIEPAKPQDLVINSPLFDVNFSQNGGCIQEALLKNYFNNLKDKKPVDLLISHKKCRGLGFKIGNFDLRNAASKVERKSPEEIKFTQLAEGLEVSRTFIFNQNDYYTKFNIEIKNITANPIKTKLGFEMGASSDTQGAGGFFSNKQSELRDIIYRTSDKINRDLLPFEESPKADSVVNVSNAQINWLGTSTRHFLFAAIPLGTENISYVVNRTGANLALNQETKPDQTEYEAFVEQEVELQPGTSKTISYDVYMGPKKKEFLQKYENLEFVDSIDYGFFKVISWPLSYILNAIYKVAKNWGVAIIVLTCLIRLLFYPLSKKAYIASKKMLKIQPEIAALKEKYKDDKTKLNQETMALMASKGANPMSGCLPILPQMPVFFGLNAVFMYAFELRHAPFVFWLNDLAAMDHYYITPIILAVLYYIQQKIMPVPTTDPTQAKIMQFLPVMFAIMMLSFPSGLVLYTIVNAAISIAQQQYMMKKYKDV